MTLGMMSAGAMGGGISSSVARALGSGNRAAAEAAARACAGHRARHGASCSRSSSWASAGTIYGALGGSGRALDGAEAFATVLFLGCVAHWVANSMASVLRGTGDMKTPGYALVATAALQIPLTGALTLGWFGLPALGIRGPAAASVISFTLAALWMAGARSSARSATLRLRWPRDGFRWAAFRDILKVGLIACLVVILTNGTVHGRHRPDRPRRRCRHRRLRHRQPAGIHADPHQLRHRRHARPPWSAPTSAPGNTSAPSAWRWSGALMAGAVAAADRHRRGDLARPLARPVHQTIRGALAAGRHLSQHRRPGLRLLRRGDGALLRLAGHRRDDVAGRRQPHPHHHRRRRQPAGARPVRLGRVAALSPAWRPASSPSPLLLAFSTTRRAWTGA